MHNSTEASDSTSASPSSAVSSSSAESSASNASKAFDLQAHRGGRGETTEESARAFEKALELGVTTLEFDIVTTKDNVPAVWHDNEILDTKCEDTAPVIEGDPAFPYVGKFVHDLTWEQLQTLNCGKKLEGHPDAEVVEGNKIIQLSDVLQITDKYNPDVQFNIETKTEADKPETSASPEESVNSIMATLGKSEHKSQSFIQSFDWRTLRLVHQMDPTIPLILLWDDSTWHSGTPWSGDVYFDSVNGDIIAAAQQLNGKVLSPGYSEPYGKKAGESGFKLVADKEFVDKAHAANLQVIPWTINDEKTMAAQIDAGADGLITHYPTKARTVMEEKGMTLPKAAGEK